MRAPCVSVITPAYNDAARVGDAVRSIRSQTFPDWEMIVVDDGSRDATADAARAAADGDARVRVMSLQNGGVSRARNAGLAHAQGRFVHFLDSDDWLAPTCLAQLVASLDAAPEAALAAASYAAASDDGRILETYTTPAMPDPRAAFARTCAFPVHAALTRAELVRAAGGFDETLPACEDWDLWLKIAASGRDFLHAQEVLAIYRRRAGSLTRDSDRMARSLMRVIPRAFGADDRWAMIDALMSGLFYVMGGAVALDQDLAPAFADLPDIAGWSFDASIAAHSLTAGIAYASGAPATALAADWNPPRTRLHAMLDALGARIGHARDCDLLRAHVEARLCGPRAFAGGFQSMLIEARACDIKAAINAAPDEKICVRALHENMAGLGSVETPPALRSFTPSLAAASREWTSKGLADELGALASDPLWSAAQIASRQPNRPSRAALREGVRACASRIRAARFDPSVKKETATRAGRGAPRLRVPIVTIGSGSVEAALSLAEALDMAGSAPEDLHEWLKSMRLGAAARGRAHVLTIADGLAPPDHPDWSALAACGARALVFVPIDAQGQSAWPRARLRELAALGLAFGWAVPREAPDWETAGTLARACADAAAFLNETRQPGPPIASIAAGGGARFLVERLRDAGFVGALGHLTGQTHLDDPAFDLRRVSLDATQPIERLMRIVTAA